MNAVLPCPFCGAEENEGPFPGNRANDFFIMRCGNPGCQAEIQARHAEEALVLWNKRPPAIHASIDRDKAIEALVKEIEHEADMLIADKYGTSSNPERHTALIWFQGRLESLLEGRK